MYEYFNISCGIFLPKFLFKKAVPICTAINLVGYVSPTILLRHIITTVSYHHLYLVPIIYTKKMINVQESTKPPTLVSDLLYNSCSANVCVRIWITNNHRGRDWVFCSIRGRDWRHFQFNLTVAGGCLKSIGVVRGGKATRCFQQRRRCGSMSQKDPEEVSVWVRWNMYTPACHSQWT